MQSYFFIPANRLHKIDPIRQLNIDQIIIDLEDAVKFSERNKAIEELSNESIDRNLYIRVPLYDNQNHLDLELYHELKHLRYKNFIFPKLKNESDFEILVTTFSQDTKCILLIETPLFLVQIGEVLKKHHQKIQGIGLGSHDLMGVLNANHTLDNLNFYRNFILLHAKAYEVEAFDIASMELKDGDELKIEILDGFQKGFDAKFYIHPWQIEQKDLIKFYNLEDLDWAKKIYTTFQEVGNAEEFNPIVVEGEIIEKPHLNKVFTILKYFKQDESK